ncbi:MAG: cytochrome C oxidase subunit II [Chloroflexi bacterium]|nr:cupredoxin domain-containing protein [Ardenticatenaceae bacterium]MBL1127759.1 cytochrome C oxidase subunit II [Chloroflexota bacterium]NOG33826.1 cytochrome C oxidase subunit II [Chloroflexota bacterium]GIK54411.1 MAG: cytochrome c oxidase subunit II [Chloroflexota bacterium]
MHIDTRERNYIVLSVLLMLIFATALMVSAFAYGIQVPVPYERVDPRTVATPGASPWGNPVEERVRELAPNKYEAYILAQAWVFLPNKITIPKGSSLTLYVTSKDVQHGFNIQGTNINMMILPGQVSTLTATFDKPGTYNIVCNEYCGVGHQTMYATIEVQP